MESAQEVCVSRCTIWPILVTSPLFQAIIPTTRVPRIMAAPITHSRVDCPRCMFLTCSSNFRAVCNCLSSRRSAERPLHDSPEKRNDDQDHEFRQVDSPQNAKQFRAHRGCLG